MAGFEGEAGHAGRFRGRGETRGPRRCGARRASGWRRLRACRRGRWCGRSRSARDESVVAGAVHGGRQPDDRGSDARSARARAASSLANRVDAVTNDMVWRMEGAPPGVEGLRQQAAVDRQGAGTLRRPVRHVGTVSTDQDSVCPRRYGHRSLGRPRDRQRRPALREQLRLVHEVARRPGRRRHPFYDSISFNDPWTRVQPKS